MAWLARRERKSGIKAVFINCALAQNSCLPVGKEVIKEAKCEDPAVPPTHNCFFSTHLLCKNRSLQMGERDSLDIIYWPLMSGNKTAAPTFSAFGLSIPPPHNLPLVLHCPL